MYYFDRLYGAWLQRNDPKDFVRYQAPCDQEEVNFLCEVLLNCPRRVATDGNKRHHQLYSSHKSTWRFTIIRVPLYNGFVWSE